MQAAYNEQTAMLFTLQGLDKKIPRASPVEAFQAPTTWQFDTRCKVVHYASIAESLASLAHSDYQAVFTHEILLDGQSTIQPWRIGAEHAKIRKYIRETLPNLHIEESVKYVLAEKIYMPPGIVASANRESKLDFFLGCPLEKQIPVSELTKSLYECSSLLRDHKQLKEAATMQAEKCFKVRCVMHDAHVRHQWDPDCQSEPDMGKMHLSPNTEVYW